MSSLSDWASELARALALGRPTDEPLSELEAAAAEHERRNELHRLCTALRRLSPCADDERCLAIMDEVLVALREVEAGDPCDVDELLDRVAALSGVMGDAPPAPPPAATAVQSEAAPAPNAAPAPEPTAEPAAAPAPELQPAPAAPPEPALVDPEAPAVAAEAAFAAPAVAAEAAPAAPAVAVDPAWSGTVDEGDRELLGEFVVEATELLDAGEQQALRMDQGSVDADGLNAMFRAFHTIKGVAGFLKLVPATELTHDLESLLDKARRGEMEAGPALADLVLRAIDRLRKLLTWVEPQSRGEPSAGGWPHVADLVQAVRTFEPRRAAPARAAAAVEAEAEAPAAGEDEAGRTESAGEGEGAGRTGATAAATVKVDTGKLDSLVDLVGELLIAQSMVVEDPDVRAGASQRLVRNLSQLVRISKDLQRTSMAMRMVPIAGTFQKMERIARDVARTAGKRVVLEITGGETELDRTVVEILHDPLVHMIRNAVDHGLEAPDQRTAAGKEPVGRVHLRAGHEGGQVVVEISDDGRGMDPQKLIAKAREKGLIGPNDQLSEAQAYNLIFAPGFSTAAKVTGVSGRGVGMDVVKTNVERVRGRVEVDSTLGQGSRFRVRLPLTLAIIDGLVVGVGGERFILPTEWAQEALRPKKDEAWQIYGSGEALSVRGSLVPLLRLADLFGMQARHDGVDEGLAILVGHGRRRCCLLVDELIGRQEVVIKSLGETFASVQGLAGGAILGDGRVGLILDVPSVLARVQDTATADEQLGAPSSVAAMAGAMAQP